jgi:hypothetical protein
VIPYDVRSSREGGVPTPEMNLDAEHFELSLILDSKVKNIF